MSNINQYPLTATQINDEDFYDVDYWNGVAYESRKISGLTLKTILQALPPLADGLIWQGDAGGNAVAVPLPSGDNIYNADGTLTGQRIVDMDDNGLYFVTNDGGSQNLIMGIFDQGAAHRVEIGDTFYINDINLEVKGLSLFYNSPIINNSFSNIL